MNDTPQVTVVVPFHTQREASGYLQRALTSIDLQTVPVKVIAIRDELGQGAPATREAGLQMVDTPWVSFLDSDDQMDPHHIEVLLRCAWETGADYVYSHYRVKGGGDPRPHMLGRPWDNNNPDQTTIVTLVRTELAKAVGFRDEGDLKSPDRLYSGEDWRFTLGCIERGAKIVHHPEITWTWHHHGRNTSGLPGRGDAI
jgi:glycosyltransferase involved in cell wall biosynthesis